jgi:predicted PurR-regulated permease PerM
MDSAIHDENAEHTGKTGDAATQAMPLMGTLTGFVVVGLALVLMHLAAPVLVPVLFAFFLASLAWPAFQWLQKRGMKRGWALVIMLIVLAAGGIALVLLALSAITHLQSGLAAYSEQLEMRLAQLNLTLEQLGIDLASVLSQAGDVVASLLGSLLIMIAEAASAMLVSFVVVMFFLLESSRFASILNSKTVQHQPFIGQLPEVARTAMRYFGIRTRLNFITGAGVTVVCLLLGIDYPLLWGMLAFVLSYIPYIGLFTAMVPPTLLALAEHGWLAALTVIVAITAINLTIENVLEPGYTGKRLQLSPTVVFLSFFFWAWLLGPVGALLSMPITAMLLLVLQREEKTSWLAQIIGRKA